jgi:hypothetical protein
MKRLREAISEVADICGVLCLLAAVVLGWSPVMAMLLIGAGLLILGWVIG